MFMMKRTYLTIAVDRDETRLLLAEWSEDAKVSVLASDVVYHNRDGATVETDGEGALRFANVRLYSFTLKQRVLEMSQSTGLRLTSAVVVLPSGGFSVLRSNRPETVALQNGIVTREALAAALDSAPNRNDAIKCVSVPYGYDLDGQFAGEPPLGSLGRRLGVLKADYWLKNEAFAEAHAAMEQAGLQIMQVLPVSLAEAHGVCPPELLAGEAVVLAVDRETTRLTYVTRGFEQLTFPSLPFGTKDFLASAASKADLDPALVQSFGDLVDLRADRDEAVVRTFSANYRAAVDTTVGDLSRGFRASLNSFAVSVADRLARQCPNVETVVLAGALAAVPGSREALALAFDRRYGVAQARKGPIGARNPSDARMVGAVSLVGRINDAVGRAEYSSEPFVSAELDRSQRHRMRSINVGKLSAKALEGVLGNR